MRKTYWNNKWYTADEKKFIDRLSNTQLEQYLKYALNRYDWGGVNEKEVIDYARQLQRSK